MLGFGYLSNYEYSPILEGLYYMFLEGAWARKWKLLFTVGFRDIRPIMEKANENENGT